MRFVACLEVKMNRLANLAEEHGNYVAMMRLDMNIRNLIKAALTYGSDLAIHIFAWIAFSGLL